MDNVLPADIEERLRDINQQSASLQSLIPAPGRRRKRSVPLCGIMRAAEALLPGGEYMGPPANPLSNEKDPMYACTLQCGKGAHLPREEVRWRRAGRALRAGMAG